MQFERSVPSVIPDPASGGSSGSDQSAEIERMLKELK